MIDKLTPEQIARFPEFVKKWTDIGLSTQPANRAEAEQGIRDAYAIAKLAPPRIVWCGSPLSQGITRAIILDMSKNSVWDSVGASVGDSVRDSVRASVWDSVRASVRASVRDSVWDSVWDSVGASVGASVRDSVRDSVWDSVRASVRASVRDSVGASVWDSGHGQHDASWVSFYDFLREVCSLTEQTNKLEGITRISRNAGWWLPHEKICWVSERHNVLKRNAQGRLHCDGGPAVSYPDGWCIYVLNGVRVKPEYALTPAEKISPDTVFAETNAEVRRELIRKIGVERFLAKAPHKVLDTQGNYTLLSVELSSEVRDARYLKMLNPSVGCWHVEAVDPECSTVEQANNWRATRKIDSPWQPIQLT